MHVLRAVEHALRHGAASPSLWEGPGTPLRAAVQSRAIDLVVTLLQARGDPNERDEKGVHLLHLASFEGQAEICRALLSSKADVNARDCNGQTAMFFAPSRAVCTTLYNSHADLSLLNVQGQSAVHMAAQAGLADVLVWQSNHAARGLLCLRDNSGGLAVEYARQAGVRADVVERLEMAFGSGRLPQVWASPFSSEMSSPLRLHHHPGGSTPTCSPVIPT